MKFRTQSYLSRRTFTFFVLIMTILLLFVSPVTKAQNDSARYFDADFPAQALPSGGTLVENNLANPDSIKTELDIWEEDLGKEITDGSYVGSIFESSIFEMDYLPLIKDDTYTFKGSYIDRAETVDWNVNPYFSGGTHNSIFPELPEPETNIPYGYMAIEGNELGYSSTYFDTTINILEKRSLITVGEVVNFTNRVIMSGATDFWVKLPIQASCLSFNELTPTFSMFEMNYGETLEEGDLILQDGYGVVYDLYPTDTVWNPDGGNHSVTYSSAGSIMKEYGGFEEIRAEYKGRQAILIQPIQEKYIFGENIYVHVFATVEPNTNYTVAVTGILKSKPVLNLVEDDICSNGRRTILQTSDLEFLNKQEMYYNTGIEQRDKKVLIVKSDEPLGILTGKFLELPVDASFSFIFKAGRGDYGMYGQTFDIKAGNSLVFYRDIDFSTVSGDRFVSVMIPFISDKSIVINLTVELLPTNSRDNKFEGEGYLHYWYADRTTQFLTKYLHYWQSEEPQTYRDYILFSTPLKVLYDTLSSDMITVKIIVNFVEDAEINFMFSTIDSAKIHEKIDDYVPINYDRTQYDTGFGSLPSYKIRKHLTYLYNKTSYEPFIHAGYLGDWHFFDTGTFGGTPTAYSSPDMKNYIRDPRDCEIVHSELFCSVQLTDGMWHQIVTSSEGYQYASHFFERRVAVGLVEVWVDTTNNESAESKAWYDEGNELLQEAFEMLSEGNILGAISGVISGAISLLWNGLQAFLGSIIGVFTKVWDGLVAVGSFLKTVLTSFVGQVLSIIGDIVDNLEKLLNPALYIIALLIFMYVIAWSGKLIYNPTGGL